MSLPQCHVPRTQFRMPNSNDIIPARPSKPKRVNESILLLPPLQQGPQNALFSCAFMDDDGGWRGTDNAAVWWFSVVRIHGEIAGPTSPTRRTLETRLGRSALSS